MVMLEMARRTGRKRLLDAERWNDGKTKQNHVPVGEIRRARDALLAGMRHPEWGTVCGLLFLSHKITPEQFAASKRFDEAYSAYAEAIGVSRVKTSGMQTGVSSHPPDPDSEEGRAIAKRHKRTVDRYLQAFNALDAVGTKPRKAVIAAIQERQHPSDAETVRALIRGLESLAAHYRLTNHRNAGMD